MKKRFVLALGAAFVWLAAVALSRSLGATQSATPGSGTRPEVTKAECERWKVELSNWGRWGKEDQLGAMNLVTPAKRKQAAALVKDGVSVSLAGDAETEKSIENPRPYEHVMYQAGPVNAGDSISVSFHGYAHTHIDAFSHRFFDRKMWNGFTTKRRLSTNGGSSC